MNPLSSGTTILEADICPIPGEASHSSMVMERRSIGQNTGTFILATSSASLMTFPSAPMTSYCM